MDDKTKQNQSPKALAWKRFRSNKLGMLSCFYVIVWALLALFAYLVIPDKTPNANRQLLEISTKKPGFEVDMLMIPKETPPAKTPFFKFLLQGRPDNCTYLPFDSLHINKEQTTVFLYQSEVSSSVRTEIVENKELIKVGPSTGSEAFGSAEEANDYIRNHCVKHRKFLLGTDQFGRDFLSRLILGSRISLTVGFIAVLLSLMIGIMVGSLGGFFRGKVDDAVVWFINVVWSIPTLLLVIAITFALGKGIAQVFIAVGLTMWVEVARIVRGQILSIRETTFVEAGRALGFRDLRIIFKHILPNILNPIIVVSAANFASAILLEAGLSFLGIGVQPPMPSWGSMIKENYAFIILDAAYLALLPGIAIMLLVLAFMLIGNALREALDVKN
jgi:peptide/nickel transport system permease protein